MTKDPKDQIETTESTKPTQPTRRLGISRRLALAVFIPLGVLILITVTLAVLTIRYQDHVYPHTLIGSSDFSGMSQDQATKEATAATADLAKTKITINIDGTPSAASLDDLGIKYDATKTANNLLLVGRSSSFFGSIGQLIASLFKDNSAQASYAIDQTKLGATLDKLFAPTNKSAHDANYSLGGTTLTVVASSAGQKVNIDSAKQSLANALNQYQSTVNLKTAPFAPTVTTADATSALPQAQVIIDKAPLALTANGKTSQITKAQALSWLTINPPSNIPAPSPIPTAQVATSPVPTASPVATVSLDQNKIKTAVTAFAKNVDTKPTNAILKADDTGKVVVATPEVNGLTINQDQAVASILADLTGPTPAATLALPTAVATADITTANYVAKGIVDLIGKGSTTFYGSTPNRIINVTAGVKTLNGMLVAPGAEFSTTTSLGTVDASTGYVKEYVISDNKTVLDYGGGLCQVSTTLFRAVLNTGLKVTERFAHLYRVSYYEPPIGLDATIYQPEPDFKFTNDTDHYILIQGQVDAPKFSASFEFYGTKDGRVVTIGDPVITNITPSGDPQYIKTDTLPVGTTKKTDSAHPGATADVTYTVTKDGKAVVQKFHSVYVPWPAKYLVGTKPV